MKGLAITGFVIFMSFSGVFGQKKHIIDIELDQCLSKESGMTTAGMANCSNEAQLKWDKELNKYYKLLMGILSPKAKEKLKLSQRQWITFRDKEYDFASSFYYEEMQGTMWVVVAAGHSSDFVRKRALELKGYYDTLTGQ